MPLPISTGSLRAKFAAAVALFAMGAFPSAARAQENDEKGGWLVAQDDTDSAQGSDEAPPGAEPPAAPSTPAPVQAPPAPASVPPIAPYNSAGSAPPSSAPVEYNAQVDADPSALATFHDDLAPYGNWENDGAYGTVWVPSPTQVGSDFAPYVTSGHWALDEGGSWLWVSDYNWGWAPFHYGRWVWISGRGWGWIPGRVYAPAWVVWRTGYYDDYYVGWAPMPPSWYWRGGFAVGLAVVPPAPYVFCRSAYVFQPAVRAYIAPPARVGVIAPRTRPYVPAVPVGASAGFRTPAVPRGPRLIDVHVPPSAVPMQRVAPPPRAAALARSTPAPPMQPAAPIRPVGATAIGGAAQAPPRAIATPMPGAPRPAPLPSPAAPRPTYAPSPAAPRPTYTPAAPRPSYAPAPTVPPAPRPTFAPTPAPASHPSFSPAPHVVAPPRTTHRGR